MGRPRSGDEGPALCALFDGLKSVACTWVKYSEKTVLE